MPRAGVLELTSLNAKQQVKSRFALADVSGFIPNGIHGNFGTPSVGCAERTATVLPPTGNEG